jgi:hypothetical protein
MARRRLHSSTLQDIVEPLEGVTTMRPLTEAEQAELRQYRQYFPFRIVFAAIPPDGGVAIITATHTKRQMNAYLRKGWAIWQAA